MILLLQLTEPTAHNLPYWSIVVLVGAVSGMFSLVVKIFSDQVKQGREERLKLNQKLDTLHAEQLEDQKKMAVLLNDNIKLIKSLTKNT